ncbi:MAG: hypothetical protein HY927_14880 [Elusimicrobia bacterium]|nr:hypothetical protein [Elusimicrobiota bacterium]
MIRKDLIRLGCAGALALALTAWMTMLPCPSLAAEAALASGAEDKAEYVGAQQCASCHDKAAKKFGLTTHGRQAVSGNEKAGEGCESCHGPGSLHVQGGGDLKKIIRKPVEACFKCHSDKKLEFSMMYRHPVPDGKMTCGDCHALHDAQHKTTALKRQQEVCLRCHQEMKGPWTFEHEPVTREACTTCHAPHGSANPKLVVERDYNLCLKCHYAGAQFQSIGHYAHRRALNPAQTAGPPASNCSGCHRAVHGSNFSKELRMQ